jgi:hypothetical protein
MNRYRNGRILYRFYLEPDGTVAAVDLRCHSARGSAYYGFGAVYARCNSPVAWTRFSPAYFQLCAEISADEARRRHPALFERIDAEA